MPLRHAAIGLTAALAACSGAEEAAPDPAAGFEDRTAEMPDAMQVDQPAANAEVTTPLMLSGSVPGPWFFEGDFPVELQAADGTVLAESIAQSTSNWMTSDPVGFEAALDFAVDEPREATLILSEQNARGAETVRTAQIPVILLPRDSGN